MNTLHNIVQKFLTFAFALCFSFVVLYTPQQPVSNVQVVEAGEALESTQWINRGLLWSQRVIQAGMHYLANQLNIKEFVLDPIAWLAAKSIISTVTNSVVSWINSGFNGAPMFVQDMERYMLSIGDRLANEFVQELGIASFISDPFRFDIQLAFAEAYKHARSGAPNQTPIAAPDMVSKLGSFTSGNFGEDGWDTWFRVTTQSNTYTPYGSLLAAQEEASLRILGSQANEQKLLHFGDGFISNKICDMISIGGVDRQKCAVSTPGQVISETLNLQLGSGIQSLIAADEISEIIVSLFAQLGQQAISGAAGLLGLSGGTGYTDFSLTTDNRSIVDQIEHDQTRELGDVVNVGTKMIDDALAIETMYLNMTNTFTDAYNNLNDSALNGEQANINIAKNAATSNISELNDIRNILNSDPAPTPSVISELLARFNSLPLHKEDDIRDNEDRWARATYYPIVNWKATIDNFISTATNYRDQLQASPNPEANAEAVRITTEDIPRLQTASNATGVNGSLVRAFRGGTPGTQIMQQINGLWLPTPSERTSLINYWNSLL